MVDDDLVGWVHLSSLHKLLLAQWTGHGGSEQLDTGDQLRTAGCCVLTGVDNLENIG